MKKFNELNPIKLNDLPYDPLVSVLIPNYNYGKFISEAIDSVLNQTYKNFELIICDDGSTDNSIEIITDYCIKNKKIKFIRKKNGGISSALNACFLEAKGEIISFLDADDFFEVDKLKTLVDDFKNYKNFGVHYHPLMRINENGRHEGKYPFLNKIPHGWLANNLIKNNLSITHVPANSGISIRKDIAIKIFPIDDKLKANVDGFILLMSLVLSPVILNKNTLSFYRLHQNNLSNQSLQFNSIKEFEIKREKEIKIIITTFELFNKWTIKHNLNITQMNVKENWQFVEGSYFLSKIKNAKINEVLFWYFKLIKHPNTLKYFYFIFFYSLSIFFPKNILVKLILFRSGQSRLKLILNRLYETI